MVEGMSTEEQKTNCPICDEYVKPVLCALNNCSWLYFVIKETKNGYERVNCDRKTVGDHYHWFNKNSQVYCSSLVIEKIIDGLDVIKNYDSNKLVGELLASAWPSVAFVIILSL